MREPAWSALEQVGLSERAETIVANLSHGEQHQLEIAIALATRPSLLLLDEATEGLAPLVRTEIWHCLKNLKTTSQSILVIDKNVEALARIGDRHYIMEKGAVVWSGNSAELKGGTDIQARCLGV